MLSILRVENHETVPRRPVDDFTHFVAAVGNFVCRQRVAEPVTEFTSVEIFKRKGKRQFGDQRAGGGVVIQCGVPGAVSGGNPDAAAGVLGFSGTHGEGGSCSRGCE